MAAPPVNTPQIEKVFKTAPWQAQAERPDILEPARRQMERVPRG